MLYEEFADLMKEEAKGLLDDPPGTNPEYERGMCELIARVMGCLNLHNKETATTARLVANEIGADWLEAEERKDVIALLKDIVNEADDVIGLSDREIAVQNAKNIKRWAGEAHKKLVTDYEVRASTGKNEDRNE